MKHGRNRWRRGWRWAALGLVLLAGIGIFLVNRHDVQRAVERASLPPAVKYEEAVSASSLAPGPAREAVAALTQSSPPPRQADPPTGQASSGVLAALPAQINLDVPFTSQAPYANWILPYKEFCEEASVLMAISYVQKMAGLSPAYADQEMLKIRDFEEKRFGYYKDTTIAETAVILSEYYKYDKFEIVNNPSVQNIKQAVASGRTVIVPAAGRLLGNPYFQPPGPLYHMYVIKGYTADGKFIVNDPGTRRGADFIYSEEVVMNTMHDWRPDGQIELGKKVVLIVG